MCQCCVKRLGRFIAALFRLIFASLSFVCFLAAIVPNVWTLQNTSNAKTPFVYLAVSVFCAGIGTNSDESLVSRVYWYELDAQNTCQNNTAIFELWAKPTGVCTPCSNTYCFKVPAQIYAQQAILIIAILLSAFLVIERLCMLCCSSFCVRVLDGIIAVLNLIFGAATFPIWLTLSIPSRLQTSGGTIPLWENGVSNSILTVSEVVIMSTSQSFNLMVAGFVFSLVSLALVALEDCSCCSCGDSKKDKKKDKKKEDEKEEDHKAALCCCWANNNMQDKKEEETPDIEQGTTSPTTQTPASDSKKQVEKEEDDKGNAALCCCCWANNNMQEKKEEESPDIEQGTAPPPTIQTSTSDSKKEEGAEITGAVGATMTTTSAVNKKEGVAVAEGVGATCLCCAPKKNDKEDIQELEVGAEAKSTPIIPGESSLAGKDGDALADPSLQLANQ